MATASQRVRVQGKALCIGRARFRVAGVTYGSFAARSDDWQFPDADQIKSDFAAISDAGLNTVRTYSFPPPEMFDLAEDYGLRLLIGLDYHDWRLENATGRRATRRILDAGRRAVAEAMNVAVGNPCVLAIAVGNEVPVDLVRLHGTADVEDVLAQLIAEVHTADPDALATYVNFPTTEYLEPPGQDLVAFNVFLEERGALRRYLQRLQVLSADMPVLLTELGFASELHGEQAQADALRWQLETLEEVGCAGGTVFAWTDEWAVADEAVTGWGFGITSTERTAKPALEVVSEWATAEMPRDLRPHWPRVSVVVCTYNEERNIEACLDSLMASDYPDLEVIVCDDGSADATVEIARRYPVNVLPLPFVGLSAVRNVGYETATGDIVAYLDADAACMPDWPYRLALSLEDSDIAATGGPNLPFPDAGLVERAISLSPGAPSEVLISDSRAEHVPGCNMAFRKAELAAVGGFDPAYMSAGDDVDVCWKLLDAGRQIGYAPAAVVHHHRRDTVRGYVKQQRGYGRAERMLSGAHPGRFNTLGQARWAGRLYGGSQILPSLLRPVVYSGYAGSAPFQPVKSRPAEAASVWAGALLPLTALLSAVGFLLAFLSPWWLPLPAVALGLVIAYAIAVAVAAPVKSGAPSPRRMRALVGLLHVAQPLARTWGRLTGKRLPRQDDEVVAWSGRRSTWLQDLKQDLAGMGCGVRIGGPSDNWDLVATSGLAKSRLTTAVAWHWEPRHQVSYRPRLFAWLTTA
ncbi:MAG: glycosyltransferase, partial [Acidimicrobiia bacterium]|nr:glycosyltransferase [Acidimicrobiia bacterium]